MHAAPADTLPRDQVGGKKEQASDDNDSLKPGAPHLPWTELSKSRSVIAFGIFVVWPRVVVLSRCPVPVQE